MIANIAILAATLACLFVALVLSRTVTNYAAAQLVELRGLVNQLRAELADLAKQTGARLAVKQAPPESDRLKPAPVKPRKPAQAGGQRRRDGGTP